MEIKDIRANQGNVELEGKVVKKESARQFAKFGKSGQVCNAVLQDETGEIVLTLWNEDVEKVNVGDQIHLKNGWCSEYKGEKQVSTGKFGKLEIVEKAVQVFSNDPGMVQQGPATPENSEEEMDLTEETLDE